MIVAYDTETTGLWKNGLSIEHEAQPKICSISAILINETSENTFEVVDQFDYIVKPDGWVIADPILPALGITMEEAKAQKIRISASDIHGITQQMAEEQGVPLFEAMKHFAEMIKRAEATLAHNESYDNLVVRHALKLLKRSIVMPEKRICTMMMSKDYCRLKPNFPGGDWKWPKLEEAYEIVFGKPLINAHSSLADITQSVELYQELKRRGVPDAGPAKERTGMKLKDWADIGWTVERIERIIKTKANTENSLTDWDRKFLTSLDERIGKFGAEVYLSEKQIDTFKKLEDKLAEGS